MTTAAPSRTRRAPKQVDPGFGRRIRELRLARKLTQADLAGAEFTKGFISALEVGRVRASLRATEIIARRLGVPIVQLVPGSRGELQTEVLLTRAERELLTEQPAAALELAGQALRGTRGIVRARALRLQGRALTELGRAKTAVTALQEGIREARSGGDAELATRAVFDLAVAHAKLDEPGESLALLLECDRALRAGELVDRTFELQVRAFLAASYVRLGDFGSADLQAERARAIAEDVVDSAALGSLYSTLSLTRERQGDYEAALTYARKSVQMHESIGRMRTAGEMWHNLALIHLRRSQTARAQEALEHAATLAEQTNNPALLAAVLVGRAELALRRGQNAGAIDLADQALVQPSASPRSKGRALLTKARAQAVAGAPANTTRGTFEEALGVLAKSPPRIRAQAKRAYSKFLAETGDTGAALRVADEALALSDIEPL